MIGVVAHTNHSGQHLVRRKDMKGGASILIQVGRRVRVSLQKGPSSRQVVDGSHHRAQFVQAQARSGSDDGCRFHGLGGRRSNVAARHGRKRENFWKGTGFLFVDGIMSLLDENVKIIFFYFFLGSVFAGAGVPRQNSFGSEA